MSFVVYPANKSKSLRKYRFLLENLFYYTEVGKPRPEAREAETVSLLASLKYLVSDSLQKTFVDV